MKGIGQERTRVQEIFRQFGWAPFRALLTAEDFAQAAREGGCAPRRQCVLTPEVMVWLLLVVAVGTSSMCEGLRQAWGVVQTVCPWLLGQGALTEEAFCLGRQRLTLRFWRGLWRTVVDKYGARWDGATRWKNGLRPLAVDGTETDVPNTPAVAARFPRPRTCRGSSRNPQARLVAVCSVFTGFCYDFIFTSRRLSEHLALRHLLKRLRDRDLLLLDRGFFSYHAVYHIPRRGAHFLLRLNQRAARAARPVHVWGPDDARVEFQVSPRTRREQPDLPAVLTARLIRYQLPGFRPSWLLTSLDDPVTYPPEELVALYHQRWGIETIYREWKHTLDIENLRSHTPLGLRKEIYSHLLLSNLVRWVMTEATQGTDLRPVQLSFAQAVTFIANALRSMAALHGPALRRAYLALLAAIRAATILQRPHRSYPRRGDTTKDKGHGKCTLPARLSA